MQPYKNGSVGRDNIGGFHGQSYAPRKHTSLPGHFLYNDTHMTNNLLSTLIVGLIAGIIGAALVVRGAIPGIDIDRGVTLPTTVEDSGTAAALVPEAVAAYDQQVINTVEKASPAVVSIIVTKDVPVIERYFEEAPSPFGDFFGGDPFTPFNFQVPRYRERGTEQREIGGGSGFLVSADGMIVTNRHVVAERGGR